MWRYIRCREILDVEQFQMWRFFRYKEKYNSHCFAVRSVLLPCMLFCRKICSFEIYADFLQNLFCRDLRISMWRKIEPKILSVEKNDKYNVLEVQGPSGPRLLAGGPSGLLTSSFTPFGRSGRATHALVIGQCVSLWIVCQPLYSVLAF